MSLRVIQIGTGVTGWGPRLTERVLGVIKNVAGVFSSTRGLKECLKCD